MASSGIKDEKSRSTIPGRETKAISGNDTNAGARDYDASQRGFSEFLPWLPRFNFLPKPWTVLILARRI